MGTTKKPKPPSALLEPAQPTVEVEQLLARYAYGVRVDSPTPAVLAVPVERWELFKEAVLDLRAYIKEAAEAEAAKELPEPTDLDKPKRFHVAALDLTIDSTTHTATRGTKTVRFGGKRKEWAVFEELATAAAHSSYRDTLRLADIIGDGDAENTSEGTVY